MKPYQKAYLLATLGVIASLFGLVVTVPDGPHFPVFFSYGALVIGGVSAAFGFLGQYGPKRAQNYVREMF